MSTKTKEPKDFGDNLYVVKTSKALSKDQEIVIFADSVQVTDNGDLIFSFIDSEGDEQFTAGFERNDWSAFYLADRRTQCPLTIQRWSGVAGIKVIERIIPSEAVEKIVEKIMIEKEIEIEEEEATEENTKPE